MAGFSISALCHETDFDHVGGVGEEVTEDQTGSPDRLKDVTSQPRPAATLHIRDPGGVCRSGRAQVMRRQMGRGITEETIPAAYHDPLLRH